MFALAVATTLVPAAASAGQSGRRLNSEKNALIAQNRGLRDQNRALKQKVFQHDKSELEAEVKKEEDLYKDRKSFGRTATGLALAHLVFTGVLAHMAPGHDPGTTAILVTNGIGASLLMGAGAYSAHQAKQLSVKVANLKSRLGAFIARGPK
jgi:hypothetical protein